jgi:hypothetical protein
VLRNNSKYKIIQTNKQNWPNLNLSMGYLYNVKYRYIYQLKLVDIVVLSILGMTIKYKQTISFQKLLLEIYLVVVLVIALLGGGTNKYKSISRIVFLPV